MNIFSIKQILFLLPFLLAGCGTPQKPFTDQPFIHQAVHGLPKEKVAIVQTVRDWEQSKYGGVLIIRAWDRNMDGKELLAEGKYYGYKEVELLPGRYEFAVHCYIVTGKGIYSEPLITIEVIAGKTYTLSCAEGDSERTTQLRLKVGQHTNSQ
jgi:hypothetical protein